VLPNPLLDISISYFGNDLTENINVSKGTIPSKSLPFFGKRLHGLVPEKRALPHPLADIAIGYFGDVEEFKNNIQASRGPLATGPLPFLENRLHPFQTEHVTRFLGHVVRGEQNEAEAMLQQMPVLALIPGEVTDLSDRHFGNITAFQYALWAWDWHMWTMLLKYLPSNEAAKQANDLEENSTEHGTHFDLTALINALDHYTYRIYTHANYEGRQHPDWLVVRREQLLVPMHVINEYCREDVSFDSFPYCRNFTEPYLPRTRIDSFATQEYALCRGDKPEAEYAYQPAQLFIRHDYHSLKELFKVRTKQLIQLLSKLCPGVVPDLPWQRQKRSCVIS
jgi:hypothetical protein